MDAAWQKRGRSVSIWIERESVVTHRTRKGLITGEAALFRRAGFGKAADGDAEGDAGAGEGGVSGAAGVALDDIADGAEGILKDGEEVRQIEPGELLGKGGELAGEFGLLVQGAAANGIGTVACAEDLSAFGDAAALAAGFVDVLAFVDQEKASFSGQWSVGSCRQAGGHRDQPEKEKAARVSGLSFRNSSYYQNIKGRV